MALDVFLFGPSSTCAIRPKKSFLRGDAYICSFDNEAYYWFLFPLFKVLVKESAQRIDLYGDALFDDTTIDALALTLIAARNLVDAQPDIWEVKVGIRMKPLPPVEVRSAVNKREMIVWLDKLEAMVREAKSRGGYVYFFGD